MKCWSNSLNKETLQIHTDAVFNNILSDEPAGYNNKMFVKYFYTGYYNYPCQHSFFTQS